MILYKDKFPVHYGQFYLLSEEGIGAELGECFAGQNNGLCGTAQQGMAFFITGLHTGNIGLEIVLEDTELPLDNKAGEIVEASCFVPESGVALEAWGGEPKLPLHITSGFYRIRYSAYDFAKAEETGEFEAGDVETYKVQIWPAEPEKDIVIKVSTDQANYWHTEASKF